MRTELYTQLAKVPDTEMGFTEHSFCDKQKRLLVKTAQITKKGSDQLAGEILHPSPAFGQTLFNNNVTF